MTGMCELIENVLCRALSPMQRYSAMRRLQTDDAVPDFLTNKWFVLFGWSLVVVLVILFFAVRRMRQDRERLAMERRFLETADRCQLTTQERELLEAVCRYAEVPKKDDIFADAAAFDLGFARLIQESFEAGHNLVQRKQLNIIVQGIRSKLGLQKGQSALNCMARDSKNLSSRQIPPNSSILVELVSGTKVLRFGATVTHTDTYELVLSPATAIEAVPGQAANIEYRLGTMVWVFETVVISCGPQGLELNHSDRVKFINRRRFPRISVQQKAKIALFPVNPAGTTQLKPPVFSDAMVTEISGPGLRIQTDLDLKTQDRILVVFEVESGRYVQDVAEVRGVRDGTEGRFVGVEMIGLSESSLNDLLRIVNSLAGADTPAFFPEGAEESSAIPETKEQLV